MFYLNILTATTLISLIIMPAKTNIGAFILQEGKSSGLFFTKRGIS